MTEDISIIEDVENENVSSMSEATPVSSSGIIISLMSSLGLTIIIFILKSQKPMQQAPTIAKTRNRL